jgi:hypothetical protein
MSRSFSLEQVESVFRAFASVASVHFDRDGYGVQYKNCVVEFLSVEVLLESTARCVALVYIT